MHTNLYDHWPLWPLTSMTTDIKAMFARDNAPTQRQGDYVIIQSHVTWLSTYVRITPTLQGDATFSWTNRLYIILLSAV